MIKQNLKTYNVNTPYTDPGGIRKYTIVAKSPEEALKLVRLGKGRFQHSTAIIDFDNAEIKQIDII